MAAIQEVMEGQPAVMALTINRNEFKKFPARYIKKIAFGDNLLRFSQWDDFYTFLYPKKIEEGKTAR